MGFFEPSVMGGGMRASIITLLLLLTEFGTGVKLDVFYTMITKICEVTTITSL